MSRTTLDGDEVDVRAKHPYGFRSGQWARLTGVKWANYRPCFTVRFPDGATDVWVMDDPMDRYEFRSAADVAPEYEALSRARKP